MLSLFAGRYILVDPIADGGMGSVWRAWDSRRRSYIAAKFLRPADASSLLRFVREQSLRIEHPHVVAPTGWAADDDQVLLTMELVPGGSMAALLGDYGTLPPSYAAVIVDQVLDALIAVHARGVVHRDVKPSNILLEPTGTAAPYVRLSDFGVAGVIGEPRISRLAGIMGTRGYVAPEIAGGADPDPRQDVYSVGIVGVKALGGAASADSPDPLRRALATFAAIDPDRRPATAEQARELWRVAIREAGVADVDPNAPDAVEVFDHVGPLPEGFGPDGPTGETPRTFEVQLDSAGQTAPEAEPDFSVSRAPRSPMSVVPMSPVSASPAPSPAGEPVPVSSGPRPPDASVDPRLARRRHRRLLTVAVTVAVVGLALLILSLSQL